MNKIYSKLIKNKLILRERERGGKKEASKHTFQEEEDDKQMKEGKKTRRVGNGHSREGDLGILLLTRGTLSKCTLFFYFLFSYFFWSL